MFRKRLAICLSVLFLSVLIFSCQKDEEDSNALSSDNFKLATLITDSITNIGHNSAASGGKITDDGGSEITAKGLCWSTSPSPTTANFTLSAGSGTASFSGSMTGLSIGTTYYVRAYATNKGGTAYGQQVSFTTISTLSIGAEYAGGIIFYLDTSEMHGLVCAKTDLSGSTDWGCSGMSIPGADGSLIGAGKQNTHDITDTCTSSVTYAAKVCDNLSLNGFSDWFLPSKEELKAMYNNLQLIGIGDFSSGPYWSSTEMTPTFAWQVIFSNGIAQGSPKNNQAAVRAARAF